MKFIRIILENQDIEVTEEMVWFLKTLIQEREIKKKTVLEMLSKNFNIKTKKANDLLQSLNMRKLCIELKKKGVIYCLPTQNLLSSYSKLKMGQKLEDAGDQIKEMIDKAGDKVDGLEEKLGNFFIKLGEKFKDK